MKIKLIRKLLLGLVLTGLPGVAGAISVGPAGYTNDFSSLPAVADFATASFGGASFDVTDSNGMDATVATLTAASINTLLPLVTGNPPDVATLGVFNSTLSNLQLRPTAVGGCFIMATLTNNTGANATSVLLKYDFIQSQVAAEEIEGVRVYYSLTGSAGSWTYVPAWSATTAGLINTNVTLTAPWNINAPFYLLFADDNGSVRPDTANQIDNFFVAATDAPLIITTQPQSRTNLAGTMASFTVGVSGAQPHFFSWYKGSSPIAGATNQTYTIPVVLSNDAGNYSVITSNLTTSLTSSVAALTVTVTTPTVSITTPTNTQAFFLGNDIIINANANAAVLTNVGFYVDGALIGNDNSSPYSLVYSNAALGEHALTAVAQDNIGQRTTSAVVNIAVSLVVPTVVITTPTNSQNFAAGTSFTVSATATAGIVTNVGFYADGLLIGNDSSSPYSFVYSSVVAGSHSLTAIVQDDHGQRATSAAVNITASAVVPTVVITTPTNLQSFLQGLDIQITASVTGGLLTNVSFYRDGGVLIGNDPSSPFGLIYSGATLGAHTLTAVVQDNLGQSATSAVVNISVSIGPGISVGLSGAGPFGFAALPTVQDGWSTTNIFGGASEVTTTAQMDAAMQNVPATNVAAPLPTDAALPVSANSLFRWNSAGSFIESRANSTKLNLLMATLRNNVGAGVGSFNVSYDFGELAGNPNESVPGFRVFYSLSGSSNSWQLVTALSTGTTGALTATISVGNWPAGSVMYLLWGDDNANGTEGSYTIDNFAITTVVTNASTPVTITNQPPDLTREAGQSAVFTVSVIGSSPYYFAWFYGTNPIGGANGPTYTIPSVSAANAGQYHVVVSNAFSSAISSNALLTVTIFPVVITNQPLGAGLAIGGSATFNVGVSGTPPFFYQWYFGASPIANATNSSFTVTNAQAWNSGIYTVQVSNLSNNVTSANANLVVTPSPFTLVAYSNVWKYNQSNVDLGTAWKEVAYDDSSWLSGPGLLAVEPDPLPEPIRTPLLLTFPGQSSQTLTYYFRSHVVLTTAPTAVTFAVTNLIDDAAVFYVNSVEVGRYGMPNGPFTHYTPATVGGDALVVGTTFPSGPWIQGTNVLAVEVHQSGATSSDIVFGMQITAAVVPPTLLTITSQPVGLIVEETKPATFIVGVSGVGAQFQWFKDGAPIAGANSASYTIPVTTTSNSGTYVVMVSNAVNFVFSGNATLLVTNYPVVITSQPQSSTNSAGTAINLSVGVSGSTPYFFTWYKENTPMAGATNQTFSIPNAATTASGPYFVIVSNVASRATSSVASLTVVVTPPTVTITTPAQSQGFLQGGSITIGAAATGGLLTNVTFYRDGGVVIASDASDPFSAVFTGAALGTHALTAVVQDNLGQSATSGVVNITVSAVQIGPYTFGTLPTLLEGWATTNLGAGNWIYTNAADIDAVVQTIVATEVITPLSSSSEVPPISSPNFQWNSTGFYLQSRPTVVGANFLVGTLRNTTGSNVASLIVAYDFGELVGNLVEELPGFRVYYSLTGTSNSWQTIPALTTGTTGALTATLSVTNWAAGNTMYLLWADDNGISAGGFEGGYTIDNFAISGIGPASLPGLQITRSGDGAVTLHWTGTGYTLQQSAELLGTNTPWADVPGPVTGGPFTTNNPAGSRFFRLRP